MKTLEKAKDLKNFVLDMEYAMELSKNHYRVILESDPYFRIDGTERGMSDETKREMERCVENVETLSALILQAERILVQNRYTSYLIRNGEKTSEIEREKIRGLSMCRAWNKRNPDEIIITEKS